MSSPGGEDNDATTGDGASGAESPPTVANEWLGNDDSADWQQIPPDYSLPQAVPPGYFAAPPTAPYDPARTAPPGGYPGHDYQTVVGPGTSPGLAAPGTSSGFSYPPSGPYSPAGYPPVAPKGRGRGWLWAIGGMWLVALVIAAVVVVVFVTKDSSSPAAAPSDQPAPAPTGQPTGAPPVATEGVTPCAAPPVGNLQDLSFQGAALDFVVGFTAACPSGDVLSNSHVTITLRDPQGVIAAGVFDYSTSPLAIPRSGTVTQHLRLPAATVFRTAESVASADRTVTIVKGGTDAATPGQSVTPVADPPQLAGSGLDTPLGDGEALADLRAIADADKADVTSTMLNNWEAQVSAKPSVPSGKLNPDLDGTMRRWTPVEILQQHLRLRQQFPGAKLLYGADWLSFSTLDDWWFTIVPTGASGPDANNGWCVANSLSVDHCFARLISNSQERNTAKTRD